MFDTETLLLIGGPMDGRRIEAHAGNLYWTVGGPRGGRYERAMLECWRGTPPVCDAVHFFRWQGMTENDAVRRLIECYDPSSVHAR